MPSENNNIRTMLFTHGVVSATSHCCIINRLLTCFRCGKTKDRVPFPWYCVRYEGNLRKNEQWKISTWALVCVGYVTTHTYVELGTVLWCCLKVLPQNKLIKQPLASTLSRTCTSECRPIYQGFFYFLQLAKSHQYLVIIHCTGKRSQNRVQIVISNELKLNDTCQGPERYNSRG